MNQIFRLVLIVSVFSVAFTFTDVKQAQSQTVTTYYTPAPTVGYVPVRRGLFGLRRGYVPVVTGSVAVPVTSYYAPAPVTTYYAPGPVTTYYAPQPAVTSFYAPAPMTRVYTGFIPPPVTTYYPPPVVIGR